MATKVSSISADTWLDSTNTSTNFGTNNDFYFGEYDAGTQTARPLLKNDFATDFSTELGQGYIQVNSAVLTLNSLGDLSSNNRTGRVYRVLRNWVENQATWNNYSTGNAWGTAGAAAASDRETTDIGSATFNSSNPSGTDNTITLTASAIEEMINGTFTNYGYLLKMDSEIDDMQRFSSKDHATSGDRPFITIDYTIIPRAGGSPIFFGNTAIA